MRQSMRGILACGIVGACLSGLSAPPAAASAPAVASPVLSSQQVAAFRNQLNSALGAAPASADGNALAAIVSSSLVAAVSADGAGSAPQLASTAIEVMHDRHLSDALAGQALAEAALTLWPGNPTAARQIAWIVANQGTSALGQSFTSTVAAANVPNDLVQVANGAPVAVPQAQSVSAPSSTAATSPSATTPPAPCPNPSCT